MAGLESLYGGFGNGWCLPGPDVQEMTQRPNDAYEVLCNLDRRVAYDNGLFGWVEELAPEPGPEGTRPTPVKVAF